MASRSRHVTLVAAAVTTVTLAFDGQLRGFRLVDHSTDTTGASTYWAWGTNTASVTTPTTGGADDTYWLAAAGSDEFIEAITGGLVVKLISTGTPTISVEAW